MSRRNDRSEFAELGFWVFMCAVLLALMVLGGCAGEPTLEREQQASLCPHPKQTPMCERKTGDNFETCVCVSERQLQGFIEHWYGEGDEW